MTTSNSVSSLYQNLLGSAWGELPGSVRSAHLAGVERRGYFRVTHRAGRIAGHLIRWSKLPAANNQAQVVLRIHEEDAGQVWERRFGSDTFSTFQWADAGCLVEYFQCWELSFELQVMGRALLYKQCGARFCFGPIRVRVPSAFAPHVSAIERDQDLNRVDVRVAVKLPLIGTLITYEGHLEVEDPQS
ncbi:MAG: DUF4166 domain-containing protein [Verrucomicrobiota bacterium]